MTDRGRWIYALPPEEAARHLVPTLTAHGFVAGEAEGDGKVRKWANAGASASLVVLEREDLEVVLVEAQGGDAVGALGALLKETGFFAQSALLSSALDVSTDDARKALLTLAHMVVAWDEDWADLFLLAPRVTRSDGASRRGDRAHRRRYGRTRQGPGKRAPRGSGQTRDVSQAQADHRRSLQAGRSYRALDGPLDLYLR